MGKTVAMIGGAMYAIACCGRDVLELPAGTTAAEGASCFVNPLTALGMTETMRRGPQGAGAYRCRFEPRADAQQDLHQGLIGLVNIVRSRSGGHPAQDRRQTCRRLNLASFMDDLTNALVETGADRLRCDRRRQARRANSHLHGDCGQQDRQEYSRYGSTVHNGSMSMAASIRARSN